ncbi:hypothetical protein COU89_03420 [Candidatus Roizmanbacteria bacterium CG10_big_fil_rev_8_21_14_0_10_45_7]|uniref:Uncharacterized protein n=1 Tax=Candidatus Roizmanbacteria bacterium CG10_big_fil_rev_8_21_14_0_10_45_7 TaxID=1974854 RepID=A0A2M8KU15_9BACT|nr:MAG: hypothetical protein COU89_03420 [Candidatus Roizmanbacteria bacterium CG10_big_fil_rev_8_21_14_0_10_45_7]
MKKIILLVLVIYAVGLGYFLGSRNANQDIPISDQSLVTPSSDIQGYLLYTEENKPFSIYYPDTWHIDNETSISNKNAEMVVFRGPEGNVWIGWGNFREECYPYEGQIIKTVYLGHRNSKVCEHLLNDGRNHIEYSKRLRNDKVINFTAESNTPNDINMPTIVTILDSFTISD